MGRPRHVFRLAMKSFEVDMNTEAPINHGFHPRWTITYLGVNREGQEYGLAANSYGHIAYLHSRWLMQREVESRVGDGFRAPFYRRTLASSEVDVAGRVITAPILWDDEVDETLTEELHRIKKRIDEILIALVER